MQRTTPRILLLVCLALTLFTACSDTSQDSSKTPSPSAERGDDYGSVRVRNIASSNTDISGILYDVLCDDGTQVTKYVELEDQTLPEHLGGGNGERFADFFEVLPATTCQITATAMIAEDTPAPGCEPAVDTMTVVPGETVEVVLPIVCGGQTGAVDIVTVVGSGGGNGLTITAGTFGPSKFITRCQSGVFTIEVEGGDGNYSYAWEIIDSPQASFPQLILDDNRMAIRTDVAGEYKIRVTVTDGSGNTANLEFPVHVGADGIFEDCEDICCTIPGENETLDAYITTSASTCEALGGNPEDLQLGDASVCDSEVCCKTANGIENVPATECLQGQRVDPEMCVENNVVCCAGTHEDGYTAAIIISAEECEQLALEEPEANVSIVDQAICFEEVCCEGDNGILAVRPLSECEFDSFAPQAPSACTTDNVCCIDGDLQSIVPGAECQGTPYAVEACENTVCCSDPNTGDFTTQVDSYCTGTLGGEVADPDACSTVCCQLDPEGATITTQGYCEANGTPANNDDCEGLPDRSYVWNNAEDMDPNVQCADTPYLVVPSSADNKAIVYDLATLEPLPTSPFNVCGNPSRVMMDANTDVYIACRTNGASQLQKYTRDGLLLWQSDIDTCQASRAVTMTADGRLFAGCGAKRSLYEIDPSTGATLANLTIPGNYIYGAWGTPNGVWVSGGGSYLISYVEHTPSLQVKFTIDLRQTTGDFNTEGRVWRPYGVSADAEGNGWFAIFDVPNGGLGNHQASMSKAIKVDTNGVVTAYDLNSITWTSTGLARGIQVGLDGLVRIAVNSIYNGHNGEGGLIVLDPVTGQDQYYPANQAGGSPQQPATTRNFVIGVTSDSNNNTYTLDRMGQRVIRIAPDGTQTSFGRKADANGVYQQILREPYGYSGDMTGLSTTCISGSTQEIIGDTIDSSSAGTVWDTISWTSMEPTGTNVRVFYRIQGTTQWIEAVNGAPITGFGAGAANLVGRNLELKTILGTTVAPIVPRLNNVTVTYR